MDKTLSHSHESFEEEIERGDRFRVLTEAMLKLEKSPVIQASAELNKMQKQSLGRYVALTEALDSHPDLVLYRKILEARAIENPTVKYNST